MIRSIIAASIANRFLVLLFSLVLAVWGWKAVQNTPLDAIPDLSDVQVIVKTPFAGQSPQLVEDQVTYPISSLMMSVPKAKAVRGYSFFGDSYVYILFEEGTDPYWARSRVLEYLNQVKPQLPDGVQPRLGPDASGVGWVYQYALVDRTHSTDLAELRSLQDWFLKYELQSVPGVSEVASVGGMVKQYQVVVDPNKLRGYNLTLEQVQQAIRQSATEMGASVIELAEAEYMVGVKGYVTRLKDLQQVPVGGLSADGTPLLLKDIARVQLGAKPRRGIAELNGEGEVVGGIVVMRSGENALNVIQAVKAKLDDIRPGLPEGVDLVEVYNRSGLIERSVATLKDKLLEEMIVVALVSLVFLFHLRSALVAVVSLPLGILGAFIIMEAMGVTANIMSLGGIAIAIGTMVDAAIVMIENAHKHLEAYRRETGEPAQGRDHWRLVRESAQEVGLPLFLSLLIIALSFVPIFALQEQAGRLFTPLALTKTLAMAVAAGLAITLVPVLMGWFIRGRLPSESANPLNRWLVALYRPVLQWALRFPKSVLVAALVLLVSAAYPWQHIGSEFMPELEEGDLLYMPTTLPGLSIGNAQSLLQQTDRIIKSFPEVKTVFGKIGRADTATDPAPLTMIETTIQLKDKSEWREGMTLPKLIQALNEAVAIPGLTNAWVQPIKTRIDMLSTGIKTPIGIKIAGDDLAEIQAVGEQVESAVSKVPGTLSAFSDRSEGGRYIDILPKRAQAARYGLSVAQVANIVASAVGGQVLQQTIEGRERYSLNLRYPQAWRNSVESLKLLPIVTASGAQIQLGMIADIKIRMGPPMIKSENARLNGWTFVDLDKGTDLVDYIQRAKQAVADAVPLPPGISVQWTGQYEYLLKAQQTLYNIVPLTLIIIFVLLYIIFKQVAEALMILLVIPFALLGSVWFLWWLGYDYSIAVAVGMIALAGVATEFGVVMLLYLKQAIHKAETEGRLNNRSDLAAAIMQGAVQRVRPKAMTVSVIVIGLLPILFANGTGAEVMKRIAAPMVGGMISAPLVSMLLIPLLTYLLYAAKGFGAEKAAEAKGDAV
ncbi:efflux RND transporter permease subunit [Hydrogenovibrio thermophilus]|jgi:heavy metal efflux pump (cobalt-zinc-cadmium)|uniref:Efflux RND transporter permease subunit n=2 Tax=Pseudomonadota TaxID=1224 RepID=A0A410H4N6_9GAMM|nr:CusA/CzcA family heavy metal efflux RND transporter [Hydrogenovibrio thermophilus]QAB15898.1 efflux RND transporter permease subunit [Hydrogenovibrio thermophilus]